MDAAPRNVAVIDVGKTNAKLVLYDLAEGRQRGARVTANTVLAGPPYPHADADGLFDFILDGLRDLAGQCSIDAVSISAHGACAALVDEAGELVLPILDYEHPLAGAEAYDELRPPFAQTLSPPMENGLNVGRQLYWLQANHPAAFGRARNILFHPQYWAFRLTGVAASEATSLGCHTDLWSCPRRDYSDLVDRMGWRPLLPPLRKATDRIGSLKPELAARIGLAGRIIPVSCGIHDSNAALLPHLLSRPAPFTLMSTGTWVVSFAVGGRPVELNPDRNTLAHVNAFGDPVPAASFMGGREFDLITGGRAAVPSQAALAAVLSQGIMVVPPLVPGSGPFPHRHGGWVASPADLSDAERSAAAGLYLALTARESLGLIGADGPIVVEGPLARNALFLRALGQLTKRAVLADVDGTGTCPGAALLVQDGGPGPGANLPHYRPAPAEPIAGLEDYAQQWRARVAQDATQARQAPRTEKGGALAR